MSTKLTKKSPLARYDLVESRSLEAVLKIADFRENVVSWLVEMLEIQGFDGLTKSQISFMGALDCGPNHAANLARDLGISRQAVHKIVKELETVGWLKVLPDEKLRNQKSIHFTEEGERMMSEARKLFQKLDRTLEGKFGDQIWDVLDGMAAIELPRPKP